MASDRPRRSQPFGSLVHAAELHAARATTMSRCRSPCPRCHPTSVMLRPLPSVTSRSALRASRYVVVLQRGPQHRTCASAFPSVRQGKRRTGRTVRSGPLRDQTHSGPRRPAGETAGAGLLKSSESCWMRGSCDTCGYGNGPDRGGSVGSSPPAVHEVELLRLCVIWLEIFDTRSATPAEPP